MKRLIFLLLLCPAWASASVFYVDCGAAAGGDGSLATPWDAVADVNAASFSAGDSVLFAKGCTWREQLVVPSSGSAAGQITFGAYGTGANPTISGADILGGGGWTGESVGNTTVTSSPADGADDSDMYLTSNWWENNITTLPMGIDGANGDVAAQVRFVLNVPQGATIVEAHLTLVAATSRADDVALSIAADDVDDSAQVANNTDFEGTRLARLTTASVPWTITTDSSAGTAYDTPDIKSVIQELVNRAGWATNNHANIFFTNNGTTGSKLQVFASSTHATYADPVLSVTYSGGASATAYYTDLASAPTVVIDNGVWLSEAASKEALATAVGQWYHDTGNERLYVRSTADVDPTSRTIEGNARSSLVWLNGKDYITLSGLTVYGSADNGINLNARSDGVIISGCTVTLNGTQGIQSYSATGTQNDGLVTGNTVTYNGGDGIQISRDSHNWVVSYNNVHHNALRNASLYLAGIKVLGSLGPMPSNVTVERNTVYSNGDDTDEYRGAGIWLDTVGTGCVVRYNHVYNNMTQGIEIEKTVGASVYYNIVTGHSNYNASRDMGYGIAVLGNSAEGVSTDNLVYNNVCYGNRKNLVNEGSESVGTSMRNVFLNNISLAPTGTNYRHLTVWGGGENDGTNGSGNVYEHNAFGAEPLAIAYPAGGATITTYAGFDSAYGATTHNVTTDPLFLSASDFHLQLGSPAINAGVDVGLTSDFEGTALPIGAAPDIGAYENLDYGSYTHIDGEINLNPPTSAVRRVGGN